MAKKSSIELQMRERSDRSKYLEVKVRSQLRPHLKRVGILEQREVGEFKVMILAAALAEEFCERYGDTLDPDRVAHAAAGAYRRMMEVNPHLKPGTELPRDADRYPGAIRMAQD